MLAVLALALLVAPLASAQYNCALNVTNADGSIDRYDITPLQKTCVVLWRGAAGLKF